MSDTHYVVEVGGRTLRIAKSEVDDLAARIEADPSADLAAQIEAALGGSDLIGTAETQVIVPDDLTPPEDDA